MYSYAHYNSDKDQQKAQLRIIYNNKIHDTIFTLLYSVQRVFESNHPLKTADKIAQASRVLFN